MALESQWNGRFPNRTLNLQNVPTGHWYHPVSHLLFLLHVDAIAIMSTYPLVRACGPIECAIKLTIIPTSLAVAYSNGKYTKQNWSVTTWHALQSLVNIPASDGQPWNSEISVDHHRGVEEWPVGTFCKYNVLLGNLPLYYRMFPPAIDNQSKITLVEVVSDE